MDTNSDEYWEALTDDKEDAILEEEEYNAYENEKPQQENEHIWVIERVLVVHEDPPMCIEKKVQQDMEHDAQCMNQPTPEEFHPSQFEIDETMIEARRVRRRQPDLRYASATLAQVTSPSYKEAARGQVWRRAKKKSEKHGSRKFVKKVRSTKERGGSVEGQATSMATREVERPKMAEHRRSKASIT